MVEKAALGFGPDWIRTLISMAHPLLMTRIQVIDPRALMSLFHHSLLIDSVVSL